MSGHNKWSSIKHRKGAQDAKRGRIFTKIIKEITVSARIGGGDPAGNPRLRSAILDARANNMPNDTLERAIKKGTGELEGVSYEEVTYEGYGPEGVAVLVDTMTDNKNRTVGEVRQVFNKRNGRMGEPGSVAWMFEEKGHLRVDKASSDYERLFEVAATAGAEDVEDAGDQWLVTTAREDLYAVSSALEEAGMPAAEAKLAKVPKTTVDVTDPNVARKVLGLIEALEDHDDVQTVWANFDISDEVAAQLGDE